ncbi:IS110 family RNA-guided transposase [Mycolicibacter algericus]|uniref:IS110 family transposase n=2 Tax=Mycolicibacter algericus TaxID=1288388 RepID=A0A7I9YGZ7_MYCAL|nr:IS110 family transposase [Mycolicibacter algericus]OQZ97046.1 IS110 family transposase [Mycolicibacter algericus DSM 45454]GFG87773.1 hypothetical protein MALGJ_44490 [Mycolicibacter algericus]
MDVVLGVDAHKRTHTLVAVDGAGRKLAEKTVPTTTVAHQAAIRWARQRFGTELVWAVEDCRSLTARLERDLLGAGHTVVRVPPHLMARTRSSARERGKSDGIDALAVARAFLREPDLPVAYHDPTSMQLRVLVDRRDDLVVQRTGTINRLLVRIHHLDPGHHTPRNWVVKKARAEVAAWLASEEGLIAELARDELGDIERLFHDVQILDRRIGERIRVAAPALLDLHGCGELTAARIVAEVARVERFKSEAAFARYVGLAPIPHTSGTSNVRLLPTRQGNRQLNKAIHRIALTQINRGGPGKDYFQRRLDEGDNRHRALRSLKRRLARVVYTRLHTDQADDAPTRLQTASTST